MPGRYVRKIILDQIGYRAPGIETPKLTLDRFLRVWHVVGNAIIPASDEAASGAFIIVVLIR